MIKFLGLHKILQEFIKTIRKLDKFHLQLVALISVSPDVETFSYFILTTDIKIIVAFEFIRHKAHKRKLSKGISQKKCENVRVINFKQTGRCILRL